TEYFKGSTADLEAVRQAVEVPVLRKDFTFDSYQVWEARAIGADMVLLIAAALPAEAMAPLYQLVNELGMTPLIEVHNREELERVLELDPPAIGINNRNLADFSISLETTLELGSSIPKDKILVSESGIHTRQDVEILETAGVNAILVGEVLVKSSDPAAKIKELLGTCE
ncbi:MAG: indole-3-glycerol phosphate synthase TrpC, partial [Dehalococcoidia bacterium]